MLSRALSLATNRCQRQVPGVAQQVLFPRSLLAHARSARYLSAASSDDNSSRQKGGILIKVGWALLGLVAVDQLLQYRQEQEAQEHMLMLRSMQHEADEYNEAKWNTALPTLFRCKITHTEHSLDGTKVLKNIKVGDVVEVMEAEVGPNKAYNLCRSVPASNLEKKSIGWYPSEFMERV